MFTFKFKLQLKIKCNKNYCSLNVNLHTSLHKKYFQLGLKIKKNNNYNEKWTLSGKFSLLPYLNHLKSALSTSLR
jgi:hypothetical protein